MAGPSAPGAGATGPAAPPSPAPGVGALRRSPVTVARCVASEGTAGRTRPGDDLRSRRRVGARRQTTAGLRVDEPSRRAGLGLPVGELPRRSPPPLAAAHHGRQD